MAGHRRRKTRTHSTPAAAAEIDGTPRSFVFRYGKVTRSLGQLAKDLRKMMEPNTASRLKEKTANRIRDYLGVAGQLGVSHFVYVLQNNNSASHLRLFRFPHGPTFSFRIGAYSLACDVQAMSRRRPRAPGMEYAVAPIAVLSGFEDSQGAHIAAARTFFQNMFPAISVEHVRLGDCRRVVLFRYDRATDMVHVRHYLVSVRAAGLTDGVRRLLEKSSGIPDLHDYNDISEYLTRKEEESSEPGSDGETSTAGTDSETLPVSGHATAQRRIQLLELGPRLDLELLRAQQEAPGSKEPKVLYEKIKSGK